jgi:Short C-terminal domain
MAIFASTTLGSSDPSRAMSIKALEARAQALAAQQSRQEMPTSLPSPWQGASLLANTAADAFATRSADQAAAQRRQDLAGYIAKAGDNPTMADVGQIMGADQEVGKTYLQEIQQRRAQAAQIQAQKELATQKAQQDKDFLAEQERIRQAQPTDLPLVQLKRALDRGEISQEDYEAGKKKLTALPAGEQKALNEQEDTNINLQSTLTGLKEAKDLLNQGVYSGAGATTQEFLGRNLPSVGGYIAGTDPETTKRTNRYNQIVNAQALDLLSQLKGASSDKDMAWAISILNDKGSDPDTKKRALDVLTAKVAAHAQASEQRLRSMGREPVKVETPPPASGAPAAPAAAPAAPATPAAGGGVQSVASEAEAMALPPGTRFKLPDGRTGTVRP